MENIIIKCLMENKDYFKKVVNFLKPEYFEEIYEREIFTIIQKYNSKFNKIPSYDVIQMEINDLNKNEEDIEKMMTLIQDVENIQLEHKEDLEYLITKTEEYAKDVAIKNALTTSIQIASGEDKKHEKTQIPSILKEALAISINKSLGHDYFRDCKIRYDFYHTDTERIPTDIDVLNKMLYGGFPKKSLNVFVGGINVGKTLILSHLSSSFLQNGLSVLYITMEVSELRITERVDQNIFNIPNDELKYIKAERFTSKLYELKKKSKGKLKVVEYPAANATINDIENVMEELKIKDDFVPDVVMIDYLTLLRSTTFTKFESLYTFGKIISEEVRGFATIHNIPVITATQVNRAGFKKSDVGMEDIAESFAIMMTADWSCSVTQSEQLEEEGKYYFRLIKTRYSPKNMEGKKAFVGVNVEKQKLYNLDKPYENISDYGKKKKKKKKDEDEEIKSSLKKSKEKKYNFKDYK